MKDVRKEQKTAKKADMERRVKFAADQLAQERKKHLETAERELGEYRRGTKSFAFAAVIKKNLALANASPGDIGVSQDDLDELELKLIEEANQEMEYLRVNPVPERLIILRRDMQQAGYSPELLGTTRGELDGLQEKAERQEAEKGRNSPFEKGLR